MRVTFRAKLLLILGTATLTCLAIVAVSIVMSVGQARVLDDVEGRLLPKLETGPRVVAEFDHLRRSMQDAVAAQDTEALESAARVRDSLLTLLGTANALRAEDKNALLAGVNQYYSLAHQVSFRLIKGDTGESLETDVRAMQARQHELEGLIERAVRLGPNELSASFTTIRRSASRANGLRIALAVVGALALLGLSLWVRRGLLKPLADLSSGFSRFSEGEFGETIPVSADDELGQVASEANQMAANLQRLSSERDRREWLREGLSGLSDRLRGALTKTEVAERALVFLAKRVKALAGAVYVLDERGSLRLESRYVYRGPDEAPEGEHTLPGSFEPGEGLVGQTFENDELLVVEKPPEEYLRVRSALGDSAPAALVLLPISYVDKRTGVLELALLSSCGDDVLDLLGSAREVLVVALEVARSRSALQDALQQARQFAERLTQQEEELRATNQDLQVQQEELRQANDELQAQREALDRQNVALESARSRVAQQVEELARVSSYKSQFLANMSHELRTPLNSMLLLSRLLADNEDRNLTSRQVEHCKTIHGAGQDLLTLINQILDLAKIEAGKQDVRLESTPIGAFCEHARRVFEPVARQKGLELVIETGPGLPAELITDKARVERILTNLLGNALKFTERGQVTLSITRPAADRRFAAAGLEAKSAIAFSVSDTGIGIAREALNSVFTAFEQVRSTSRSYGGSGLGLAIARESARLLGGELSVESAVGQGSKFTLYLPEAPGAAPAATSVHPPAHAAPAAARPTQPRSSLLIVEDDELLSGQLADLIRDRGLGVLLARNGTQGLTLAKAEQPLGIVLDVKLPDITGWEVMERLRQDADTRNIPVHFLSASDDRQRGLSLGAIGYLTKPASKDDLTTVVQALAPGSPRTSRVLVVEDSVPEGQSLVQLLKLEGMEARHVPNATGAFQALTADSYGCIILDLGLPDMDGLGLLKAIRERPDLPRPRVVVHTGRALTKEEVRELEQYAESVVLKDGNSSERLMEEIRLFVHHVKKDALPAESHTQVKHDVLRERKLLLADDDMRTVYALSAFLRSKGAEVIVADTGKEALEQMRRHPDVQAVLMDMMMPEMDGYEAIRRLRAQPQFARLPIIALTAKAMKGERERCIEAGATDYLPKPVDSSKLLQSLDGLLQSRADERSVGI